jgi:hypothetical protein
MLCNTTLEEYKLRLKSLIGYFVSHFLPRKQGLTWDTS